MTFEEAKKELKSYKDAKYSCRILEKRLLILKEINPLKSHEIGKGISHKKQGSWGEERVLKMIELEREIEDNKIYLECRGNDIALKITKLEYPYNIILDMCYLKFFNDIKTQSNLRYSRRGYYNAKNTAIKKYSKLNKFSEKQKEISYEIRKT